MAPTHDQGTDQQFRKSIRWQWSAKLHTAKRMAHCVRKWDPYVGEAAGQPADHCQKF
jgi:hypothetical protein